MPFTIQYVTMESYANLRLMSYRGISQDGYKEVQMDHTAKELGTGIWGIEHHV